MMVPFDWRSIYFSVYQQQAYYKGLEEYNKGLTKEENWTSNEITKKLGTYPQYASYSWYQIGIPKTGSLQENKELCHIDHTVVKDDPQTRVDFIKKNVIGCQMNSLGTILGLDLYIKEDDASNPIFAVNSLKKHEYMRYTKGPVELAIELHTAIYDELDILEQKLTSLQLDVTQNISSIKKITEELEIQNTQLKKWEDKFGIEFEEANCCSFSIKTNRENKKYTVSKNNIDLHKINVNFNDDDKWWKSTTMIGNSITKIITDRKVSSDDTSVNESIDNKGTFINILNEK